MSKVKFLIAPPSRALPARIQPGTELGPYQVLHRIAHGGMATVWAARERGGSGGERQVALKTVLSELGELEFRTMFLEEARLAARIHHPNVCEIFQLIDEQGVLALAMEWVDGVTLAALLGARSDERALERRVAAQIVAQVASGLHAAHELRDERGSPMQLVHRDISPQNILLSRAGLVKVTDFGIAKAIGRSHGATAAGTIKGKLGYMSPEQAEGQSVDRRSDIFALGVVLYVASVGQHPFRRPGEPRSRQFSRLLSEPLLPPSTLCPDYPSELESIVLRALSRNAAQRFASAEELRAELCAWLTRTGPAVGAAEIKRTLAERLGAPVPNAVAADAAGGCGERPTARPRGPSRSPP